MAEHIAPRHLSPESRRLWRETTRVYALEPRHETTLMLALESLDRMREAQAAVKADGAYVSGRFGMKSHPGLAVERDSRLAFARLIRELGLDLEVPSSRPPTPWRR